MFKNGKEQSKTRNKSILWKNAKLAGKSTRGTIKCTNAKYTFKKKIKEDTNKHNKSIIGRIREELKVLRRNLNKNKCVI